MIKLVNVTKKFGDNTVLDNFSAEFRAGAYCVTGASGIGKTTLLNIILGLVAPDSGGAAVAPEESGTGAEICPRGTPFKTAAVFQEDRLCENISAVKNVALVCPKKFDKNIIKEELARVGLSDSLTKPVSQFSGGMRRRVAIVRALIGGADLIIMDEPLKGLDDELKSGIIEYIKEKTAGKIFIFVTHDKNEAKLLNAKLLTLPQCGKTTD